MTHPNTQQVASHPSSIEAYIRHGWSLVPIPPGTKGPSTTGWNQKENVIRSMDQMPHGYGIGLAHAYSGTMALDIDVWDDAAAALLEHGIDLTTLYEAPDAVVIDSGNPGHGKLLYAMPFGLALPSKKLTKKGADGKVYNYLDFRCGTANGLTVQDVLPPSIHPTTQQPYRWSGRGHFSRLPIIPQELLDLWQGMLNDERRVTLQTETRDVSWQEVRSALEAISPDVSRDEWVHVGMALKHAASQSGLDDEAFSLWNEWSAGSRAKYPGPQDLLIQWRSFRGDKSSLVTLGTLFHMAVKAGWQRPKPDVTELFKEVTPDSPDDISDMLRPPAPDLDIDLFPKVLARRATEVSESIGCDPLVPLWAGVAAVCGAIDARTRLELVPGFKVPPVLWVMTVGDPADKKSPGSRPMFGPLKALEQEDRPRYAQELVQFEAADARFVAAKKAFLDYHQSPEAILDPAGGPAMIDPPAAPTPLKIVVQDITSQKLVRNASQLPRGLLCHLDEMNSWVNKIADKRSGEDRSAWTSAYEAEEYHMDRVGAGTFHCENYAVSIYGNMQPDVFRDNLASLCADGLVQRFIPISLRPSMTRLGEPIPEHQTNYADYEQMIRTVYALPALTYRLSEDAYKEFREFQRWYEQRKRDERYLQANKTYMTAFGKIEGLTGRLALVLHAIDDPYNLTVTLDTMRRAIKIVQSFIIPSLRHAYNTAGGLADESLDQWMTDYVIRHADETELTLRGLVRAAKANLSKLPHWQADQMVMDSMTMLEQTTWVARTEDFPHTRRVTWAINPAIKTMFARHRGNVIKAKQRMLDQMYERGPQFEKFKGRKFVAGYDPATMDDDDD